jgi:hypothetical protein
MAKSKKAPAESQANVPTAQATPEPTPEAAAVVKARGPKGVADSAVVTLLVAGNPKREGSKAHARFAAYVSGKTVGETLDAGVTTPDLVYDAKHGFISIDGYDPGEIVVAKPKAEPKPKAEKKTKKEKTPEQVQAEGQADAEAAEETMA